ncbi:hypothetical protein ABW99_07050 [Pandoraea thiooxydans]|uniref:Zinc resistance-associated protein n=1 Tax=Pandoraea thiooxydans TaxID=445709 RepID=A0A0G3ETR6_9BURK|nr:periplasmic heavy metal sensor [Pandoraea thiooxydans]AKJ70428.1 hypothetical protein ABW99_07050 [Pandoraea thiooxydans]
MNDRTVKLMLVGSLILNAFLLGGIVGGGYQWLTAHRPGLVAHAPPRAALRFAADELPAERQQEFIAALKAARKGAREFALQGREGRREVLALLGAPQLDRNALDAALERTRQADMALRTRVENSVVDYAASLPPEQRKLFAEGLTRSGQWRRPPKRRAPRD